MGSGTCRIQKFQNLDPSELGVCAPFCLSSVFETDTNSFCFFSRDLLSSFGVTKLLMSMVAALYGEVLLSGCEF